MHERESSAEKLLNKYKLGTCTEEELACLEQWYLSLSNTSSFPNENEAWADLVDLQTRLSQVATKPLNKKLKYYKIIAAAAAILVFATIGTWFWRQYYESKQEQRFFEMAAKIQPGKDQARLILDGTNEVVLSREQLGSLLTDHPIVLPDGSAMLNTDKNQMAIVVTPNAGQFNFILPDGSKVWLNAASSIRYPVQFVGDKRIVEITGEVYFEIEKDVNKPFLVKSQNQLIEVLGTQFNVDAYGDFGQIATTLVHGSLRVTNSMSHAHVVLSPGQQSITDSKNKILVKQVDFESYSSWKDGVYVISNQSLAHFGKQLERWYDVEIDMGPYQEQKLSAIIRRDVSLAEVLNAVELKTQIKFKIEGRRVFVAN